MLRTSVITGFLGELRDRFCLYNKPRSIVEKLEAAAGIEGVTGVEIIYPYDFQDPALVRQTLARLGLGVAAVNVNVKGEPEFAAGSLTSADAKVRRKATDLIVQGMDAAAGLGCKRITVCPLSDGHEYPFQRDYAEDWRHLKECFATAVAHRSDVIVSLEYKPSETRVFSTLAGVHGTILLVMEIDAPNLGVTIDVGHSLYAGEDPSQALSLLYCHGVKPYIHLNDNYRNWDWDLIAGSVNFWNFLEFVWTACRHGYDDWWTFDVFPARMNPEACFATSARLLRAVDEIAGRIDAAELARLRQDQEGAVPRITEYVWRAAGIDVTHRKK